MARDCAGSLGFTVVQISMCVENMARDLYCPYLLMKKVSGNVFIYLNNSVISEMLHGFVITDSECIPENGRKTI